MALTPIVYTTASIMQCGQLAPVTNWSNARCCHFVDPLPGETKNPSANQGLFFSEVKQTSKGQGIRIMRPEGGL